MTWKCPKCGREFARENQDHYCVKPRTIDEYIEAQEETVRPRLHEIRAVIRGAIPEAEETISWSMPTYRKGKKHHPLRGGQKTCGTLSRGGSRRLVRGRTGRIRGEQGDDPAAL